MPLPLPLFDCDTPADERPAEKSQARPAERPAAPIAVPPGEQGVSMATPAGSAGRPSAPAGRAAAELRSPFFVADPEALHPALWRAHQLGAGREAVTPSGFAALDAQLPGGGWPHRVLTELLLPHPGLGEMRLLAPALAAMTAPRPDLEAGAEAGDGRCVMLFDPPAAPCGPAIGQLGLDARRWLVVRSRASARRAPSTPTPAERPRVEPKRRPHWDDRLRRLGPEADVLWALEQALKSGHVGAAMAWLPAACPADVLRRLQLAAQAHDGPVFVFREAEARSRPSVAPLRLLLTPAGVDALAVRVLKRRGPALAEPLRLVLPPVLGERQRDRVRASPAPLAVHASSSVHSF